MLALNPTRKCDQPIMCMSQLLNYAKKNYTTIKREALVMVYALHKYCHYLFGNKFVFYVNHMSPPLLGQKTPSFQLNNLMAFVISCI
jgi:hypothetical protein